MRSLECGDIAAAARLHEVLTRRIPVAGMHFAAYAYRRCCRRLSSMPDGPSCSRRAAPLAGAAVPAANREITAEPNEST
jgi:hypothetical protein